MPANPHSSPLRRALSLLAGILRQMQRNTAKSEDLIPEPLRSLIADGTLIPATKEFDWHTLEPLPWDGEIPASEAFARFRDGKY